MGLTVLTGGARSGKSILAVELAKRWNGHVSVIATAEARDDEMARRIAAHQAERPWDWTVLEEPVDLVGALDKLDDGSFVVIDCLTLWVSNLMERDSDRDRIVADATRVASLAAGRDEPVVVVTNEVGSGIVPASELARDYRDALGAVNRTFAEAAAHAYLVVAGRALDLSTAETVEFG
jgi:adenosyl cobinamide kinase/adenosyl cobinamide phosphate guanylyltransferase